MDNWQYPFWIAHRGAGTLAPENTLAAMRLGTQYGCTMFECDVKISQDNIPFLLHDADLSRTTHSIIPNDSHAQAIAGDLPWSILAQRDAGSWHSTAYKGEPIPTLERISHWAISHGYLLNIEIKPSPNTAHKTGSIVAQQVARQWQHTATPPLLSSFDPEALAAAQKEAAHLPRSLLLESLWTGWLEYAQILRCAAIICQHDILHASLIQQIHAAGMRCLTYTVNDETDMQRLSNLGVDGIITDVIDKLKLQTLRSA